MSKKYNVDSKDDVKSALQSLFNDMKANYKELGYYLEESLDSSDLCRYIQRGDIRLIYAINNIINSYKQINAITEEYLPYLIALKSEIMKTYE